MLTPRLAVYFGQPVGIEMHVLDYTADWPDVKALHRAIGQTFNAQLSTFK